MLQCQGDIVEPNDILVRIDNTVAQANFRDARSQRYLLLATVARLKAELEGVELVMPEEVVKEAPTAALAMVPTAFSDMFRPKARLNRTASSGNRGTRIIA